MTSMVFFLLLDHKLFKLHVCVVYMFQSSYLKPSDYVCSLETAADVTAMQIDKERYAHGFKVPWPPRILKKGWNPQSIPPKL